MYWLKTTHAHPQMEQITQGLEDQDAGILVGYLPEFFHFKRKYFKQKIHSHGLKFKMYKNVYSKKTSSYPCQSVPSLSKLSTFSCLSFQRHSVKHPQGVSREHSTLPAQTCFAEITLPHPLDEISSGYYDFSPPSQIISSPPVTFSHNIVLFHK